MTPSFPTRRSSDLVFFWPGEGRNPDMKVVVLGSGVIGVSTAYYLAKAGHEVVVLDRQPAAGLETSFAHAGEVSPGYYAPWAGTGMPRKAIQWLLQKRAQLGNRTRLDINMHIGRES